MPCDISLYRAFRSPSEFSGRAVFELYPGDFAGPVRWWNPESIYIREDGFVPFAHIFKVVAGDFWYAETRIARPRLRTLLATVEKLGNMILAARSADELRRLGRGLHFEDASFPLMKPELYRTATAIAGVVDRGWSRHGCLWLLGL